MNLIKYKVEALYKMLKDKYVTLTDTYKLFFENDSIDLITIRKRINLKGEKINKYFYPIVDYMRNIQSVDYIYYELCKKSTDEIKWDEFCELILTLKSKNVINILDENTIKNNTLSLWKNVNFQNTLLDISNNVFRILIIDSTESLMINNFVTILSNYNNFKVDLCIVSNNINKKILENEVDKSLIDNIYYFDKNINISNQFFVNEKSNIILLFQSNFFNEIDIFTNNYCIKNNIIFLMSVIRNHGCVIGPLLIDNKTCGLNDAIKILPSLDFLIQYNVVNEYFNYENPSTIMFAYSFVLNELFLLISKKNNLIGPLTINSMIEFNIEEPQIKTHKLLKFS